VASQHHLYISSVLTLSLKVFLLPYILHALIARLKIKKEVESVVNIPMTMLIGLGLVMHQRPGLSNVRSPPRRHRPTTR